MGNVLASTAIQDTVRRRGNPGTYEELHKRTKEIFPTPFEGARLIVNKALSNHFQISHTINMSSLNPPGYRFGATYVGTNQTGPGEAFPVLLGDIDPNGNLNANVIALLNPRTKGRLVAQIQDNRVVGSQVSADYKGDDFTTSMTLANVDPVSFSGIGLIQYLQSVTPNLDLGSDLFYQKAKQIPGGGMAVLSLSGRYKSPDDLWTLSGSLSTSRVNVCYSHKGFDGITFGTEIETDLNQQESTATFGYSMDLPKANASFKASIDSNWAVGGVLEKRLLPLPFSLLMSGYLIHSSRQPTYKFGMGLIIG